MKASTRYNVWAFCQAHSIVLDVKGDWRPLDGNYAWSHRFFGDIIEGITDGVVAWTAHADGRTCFVHLDMCQATPLPSTRVPKPRATRVSRPAPPPRIPQPRLIDLLLADDVLY